MLVQELVDNQEGTKICPSCEVEKPLTEFYVHPLTSDGRQGKCKECQRVAVRKNRAAKREQYSEYERARRQRPERKAYQQEQQKKYRAWNPEKTLCRRRFRYALAAGKIEKLDRCEECDAETKLQAHHDDYSRPLSVRWLCFRCHRAAHGQVVVTSNPDYNSVQV